MTQYARPSSDIENPGAWTTEPLWEKIDEEPYDDGDYLISPKSATGDSFTIGLSSVIDPEVHTGHIVRIRAKTAVTGTFKYELMQGVVVIKDSGDVVLTTAFAEYNMMLSEGEAAAITDYAALRIRVTAVITQKNQRQNVSWIRVDVPDAPANEFVYSGDVPVSVLPGTPKASLSKSYAGNIPISALPSYSSIGTMFYAGAIPLAMLPEAPIAPLEKSYAGAVGLALIPNSTYQLTVEYVYAGDVAMAIMPSYASILDRAYSGDIPMVVLPGYSSILDRVYAGAVTMSILPGYSSALDRVYGGDIPAVTLPDFPKAILEKSYSGDIDLVLLPNSIYELVEAGVSEFVYVGDIPLIALPSYVSIVDRAYQGAVVLSILPDLPKALLEKDYQGGISLSILSDVPKAALEKSYAGEIPLALLQNHMSALDMIYGGDIDLAIIPTSGYGLEAFIEVVKTVFLKSKLTERLVELKSTIKPSIVLNSEIKPEGEN